MLVGWRDDYQPLKRLSTSELPVIGQNQSCEHLASNLRKLEQRNQPGKRTKALAAKTLAIGYDMINQGT